MNLSSFGLIACGVLLNTFAQLLLKKGADAVGRFELSAARLLDDWKTSTDPITPTKRVRFVKGT